MVEETYTEKVLADDEEIKTARNKFLACVFLAGVDRQKYKDTIDELNNDYIRHGKAYPADVQSMMTWLMKRRGNGGSSNKEDDATDGVTSFIQRSQGQRDHIKCRNCGVYGHFADECPSLSEQEKARIRSAKWRRGSDDESVSSQYRSDSQSSLDSRSSGNASRQDRRGGRRKPTPPKKRTGVLNNMVLDNMAQFAFTTDRPTSFS